MPDYVHEWLHNFEPDPRDEALRVKVEEYYSKTCNDMNHHGFMDESKKLSDWARDGGYTNKELHDARVAHNMKRSK